MSGKRTHNVMLRFTEEEFAMLTAAAPPGEELAAFARRKLLHAVTGGTRDLRHASAFIVAALSPDIGFEEALSLFDENVSK